MVTEPAVDPLFFAVQSALAGEYSLIRELGRGGMGVVYLATEVRLAREVAIKVLPPHLASDPDLREQFVREAQVAARLSHPNIVPIHRVGEADEVVYFVMTYVPGITLGERIRTRGPLTPEQAAPLLREVAWALTYAHSAGLVHRDIKPDNILLDGETGRAMVTDFGIARAVQEGGDSRLTATGMAIGTPTYMSPEQAVGDKVIDGRSDLYSLGIVAYQMLAGEPPFVAANTPSMLMKHLSEQPVPIDQRADVPPDLAATIMTMLAKEPERRFVSANALLMTLDGESAAPAMPRPSGQAPVYGADTPVPMYGAPSSGGAYAPPATGGGYATGGYVDSGAGPRYGTLRRNEHGEDIYEPGQEELARWNADPVIKFRKKFATYAAVNIVIVLAAIIADVDLLFFTVVWSMFMAANYAKLWTSGYDWRDVFKQPRDRRLLDVAQETVDDVRMVFDRNHRPARRAPRVALPPGAPRPADPGHRLAAPVDASRYGPRAQVVRQAERDRDEILRMLDALPPGDRERVTGIGPSAEALVDRVRTLAATVTDLERTSDPRALEDVSAQIARLEAQANPLDRQASEERVRRLALLKRQRRALSTQDRRRSEAAGKLDSCVLALSNMRLDVLRLRAGNIAGAMDQITTLTERARSLAEEVDAAVYAADEIGNVLATPRGARRG
ncbi:MAG TPA: serine/threonine-protein kinase [Gemmatimonadaceae bacterium]|nr:serine/threonine-protein kinase [Gemmatimonadaceae bacterium]